MRIRWVLPVVIAVVSLGAHAQEVAPKPPDPGAQVDAYLKPLVEMGLFSGTVLMAKEGRVVVEAAYGSADFESRAPNQPATRFKLMSVSKSITAVAVLRLAQSGKLGLADPLGQHLADCPAGWRDVTVRELLDHTSGIANLEREWAAAAHAGAARGLALWKQLAPAFAARPRGAKPGSRHRYSNFNYVLLGLVLEAASGRPYAEVLRAQVLKPAGMERTGFDDGSRRPGLSIGYFRGRGGVPASSVQDMSVIEAAGGFFSTVGDLYRLDRALRDDTLLSAESRARMVTPTRAARAYACGWQVSRIHGRRCVHHSGGANGYVADFLRFPDDDACVVVLSNFAFAPAGRISHDLAGLLFGKVAAPARKVAPETLDGWCGVYRSRTPGRMLLVRRSGEVLLLFDVDPGAERCGGRLLVPLAADRYVLPWSGERLRFTAAADGRPASVRAERGRAGAVLERVAPPEAAWREAAGVYVTTPAGAGPTSIVAVDGRFGLRPPGGWPEQEVLPLTGGLAIALYSEEFGTLLHLERDDGGRVTAFRRQRNDGQEVRGVRRTD